MKSKSWLKAIVLSFLLFSGSWASSQVPAAPQNLRLVTDNNNRPPIAADDAYSTGKGQELSVPAPGVLANDSDPDGDPLTAILIAGAANGNLTLNGDGSFSYTPDSDFEGDDSFTYRVSDGPARSDSVTVSIDVTSSSPAVRLLYENFDSQTIDPRLVVRRYGEWGLVPPAYNLDAVGRGGRGHCFSSGTVADAWLEWSPGNSWPSDQLYMSFWMRYPTFESTDPNENIKIFYPMWDGVTSYVHYTMAGANTIYYSAKGQGSMLTSGRWLVCPNQTDGNWHHYEFYIKFSTGVSRFWYDGVLKVDDQFGGGVWSNTVRSVSAPAMDAEEEGIFSRQVDDWEVWDGMPARD